nr:MAG TPA: hypothetical protein [Caudoviricetes sp.]
MCIGSKGSFLLLSSKVSPLLLSLPGGGLLFLVGKTTIPDPEGTDVGS